MDTTFGNDNPAINVISGGAGGGPVATKAVDRSDSVAALHNFLRARGKSNMRVPRRRKDDYLQYIRYRAAGFGATQGYAPAHDYPLPALGASTPEPRAGGAPIPVQSAAPDAAPPEDAAPPAPTQVATFHPGAEQGIALPPPVRAGRTIELD